MLPVQHSLFFFSNYEITSRFKFCLCERSKLVWFLLHFFVSLLLAGFRLECEMRCAWNQIFFSFVVNKKEANQFPQKTTKVQEITRLTFYSLVGSHTILSQIFLYVRLLPIRIFSLSDGFCRKVVLPHHKNLSPQILLSIIQFSFVCVSFSKVIEQKLDEQIFFFFFYRKERKKSLFCFQV